MEKTQKLFNRFFKKWSDIVDKYGWEVSVVYCFCVEDMPESLSYSCNAGTFSTFKYLEATIYVNLRRSEGLSPEKIEYIVVHELVHLLINPIQLDSVPIDGIEYVVTTIARALLGVSAGTK